MIKKSKELNNIKNGFQQNKNKITIQNLSKIKKLIDTNIVVSSYKKKIKLNYVKQSQILPNLIKNIDKF